MNDNIENLNKSPDGGIEKQKLTDQEQALYIKVVKIFCNSTLNSDNLDEYRQFKLTSDKVLKRLSDLNLLETVAKFQERLLPTKNTEVAAEELERLKRITLMIVESGSK